MSTPEQRGLIPELLEDLDSAAQPNPNFGPFLYRDAANAIRALCADAERLERLEADLAACARLVGSAKMPVSEFGMQSLRTGWAFLATWLENLQREHAAIPESTRHRLAEIPKEPA